MRRLLAIGSVIASVGLAVVLSGANPDNEGMTYYLEFDNAFAIVEGGDLRIGGVQAGQTTRFSVTRRFPVKAVVEAQIQKPGFEALRKDATCAIRQQSLVGEYYVDCQPGSLQAPKLANGATLPVAQTQSTIAPDLVNNVMRRPYRERLRLIISELGAGLAGRPRDLAEVLRRAHPGLRETSKTLQILGRQNRIIQDFIVDSDTVVEELEAKKTEVSRWIDETGETAQISASRKREIEANFRSLPPFLDELERYAIRLGRFSDAQVPTLIALRQAAPELEVTTRELGPFARASRGSIRSLGELGDTGRSAINESREEVDQVRLVAGDLPRLAVPLRQFLQTIDDRERAAEPDPEAKDAAPPEPDKTAWENGGDGFTGMEAILAYLGIDQASALNSFDDVSHFLRIQIFASTDCTPYETNPNAQQRDRCTAALGPYSPGVTDPDPTENGSAEEEDDPAGDGSEGQDADAGDNDDDGRTTAQSRAQRARAARQRRLRARREAQAASPLSAPARPAPAPGQPSAPPAPNQLLDYLMAP